MLSSYNITILFLLIADLFTVPMATEPFRKSNKNTNERGPEPHSVLLLKSIKKKSNMNAFRQLEVNGQYHMISVNDHRLV